MKYETFVRAAHGDNAYHVGRQRSLVMYAFASPSTLVFIHRGLVAYLQALSLADPTPRGSLSTLAAQIDTVEAMMLGRVEFAFLRAWMGETIEGPR